MTDQELIDWIKQVKPGYDMPTDTGPRLTRLIQILVNHMEDNLQMIKQPVQRKPGRPKLSLNKTA